MDGFNTGKFLLLVLRQLIRTPIGGKLIQLIQAQILFLIIIRLLARKLMVIFLVLMKCFNATLTDLLIVLLLCLIRRRNLFKISRLSWSLKLVRLLVLLRLRSLIGLALPVFWIVLILIICHCLDQFVTISITKLLTILFITASLFRQVLITQQLILLYALHCWMLFRLVVNYVHVLLLALIQLLNLGYQHLLNILLIRAVLKLRIRKQRLDLFCKLVEVYGKVRSHSFNLLLFQILLVVLPLMYLQILSLMAIMIHVASLQDLVQLLRVLIHLCMILVLL